MNLPDIFIIEHAHGIVSGVPQVKTRIIKKNGPVINEAETVCKKKLPGRQNGAAQSAERNRHFYLPLFLIYI